MRLIAVLICLMFIIGCEKQVEPDKSIDLIGDEDFIMCGTTEILNNPDVMNDPNIVGKDDVFICMGEALVNCDGAISFLKDDAQGIMEYEILGKDQGKCNIRIGYGDKTTVSEEYANWANADLVCPTDINLLMGAADYFEDGAGAEGHLGEIAFVAMFQTSMSIINTDSNCTGKLIDLAHVQMMESIEGPQ